MKYFDEMTRAMEWLAEQPHTFFLGQAVGFPGTAMFNTIKGIDCNRRLEMPVCEEMQLGASLGLALGGFIPISIFPRWNFLLLAMNQLVNHIDKVPVISTYTPRVIIRTGIGSVRPLDPQAQHRGDFTEAIRLMCQTMDVQRLDEPEEIMPAYQAAYAREGSSLLVEWSDFYNEK